MNDQIQNVMNQFAALMQQVIGNTAQAEPTIELGEEYELRKQERCRVLEADAKALADDLENAFDGFSDDQIMQLAGGMGFSAQGQYFFSRRRIDQLADRQAREQDMSGAAWSADRSDLEFTSPQAAVESQLAKASQDAARYELTVYGAKALWERAARRAQLDNPERMLDYPRKRDGQMAFDVSEATFVKWTALQDAAYAKQQQVKRQVTKVAATADYHTNLDLLRRQA
jgi:hypothetical protein